MVEYQLQLDSIFGSLADPTRRDILRRVSKGELSVSEVALPYHQSLASISKHLGVLEQAHLINKHRRGRQQFVTLSPAAFQGAAEYLHKYESIWDDRFDSLEHYLHKEE